VYGCEAFLPELWSSCCNKQIFVRRLDRSFYEADSSLKIFFKEPLIGSWAVELLGDFLVFEGLDLPQVGVEGLEVNSVLGKEKR